MEYSGNSSDEKLWSSELRHYQKDEGTYSHQFGHGMGHMETRMTPGYMS